MKSDEDLLQDLSLRSVTLDQNKQILGLNDSKLSITKRMELFKR